MADRIKGITINIGGNTSELIKSLEKTDGAIKKTQTALRDVNKLLKLDPGNTVLLKQKYNDLTNAIGQTKDRLKQLRDAEEQMAGTDMTDEQRTQFEALQREIIETEQKLKGLQTEMKDFGSVGAQKIALAGQKVEELGEKVQVAGDKISGLGNTLLPVTGAVTAAATAAVKTAADFEDSMAGVQATLGITADATAELNGETVNVMDTLSGLAREMGAETKYSATQAAEAINILAMAGYDVQQIYTGLPELLNLAAAGDLEIAGAADITTGILAGFNMETDKSGDVVNKLAKLASSAKGDVSSFGAGLSAVAGQATSTGQSFDDVATALGILGNNNISASEGGTMLQRVLKNLYQPTDAAKTVLEELGVSAYNADGSARALPTVLEELNGKLSALNDEEKNQTLNKIFDTAAIRGATALMRSSGEEFDVLKGKILDSADAAQQMADVRMDTLSGQIQILKSAAEEAGIAFGQALVPMVKELVQKAQDAVGWVNKLTDAQKRTIIKVAAVVAAVGPGLIVAGKVVTAVGKVTSGVGKALQLAPKVVSGVKGIASAVLTMNPAILATVGVVTALSAAAVVWYKKSQEEIEATYGLTDAQKALHEEIDAMVSAYNTTEDARKEAVAGVEAEYGNYADLVEELKTITDENGNVADGYEARAKVITDILADALGIEIDLTDGVISNYQTIISTIDELIQKKQVEAMLSADQEAYEEALKGRKKAYDDYILQLSTVEEKEEELQQAQEARSEIWSKWPMNPFEEVKAGMAVEEATEALETAKQKAQEMEAAYYGMLTTISNHDALLEAQASGEGLAEAMENVSRGFMTAETATQQLLINQYNDYVNKYLALAEASKKGTVKVTQKQLDELSNLYTKALAELEKTGWTAGTNASTATAEAVASSDATNEAGKTAAEQYAEGVESEKKQAENAGALLGASTKTGVNKTDWFGLGKTTGENYAKGLVKGMSTYTSSVQKVAADVAGSIPTVTSKTLQERSPSRIAAKSGRNWDLGLIGGMEELLPKVKRMSESVSSQMSAATAQHPGAAARQAQAVVTAAAAPRSKDYSGVFDKMTALLDAISKNGRRAVFTADGSFVGWMDEGFGELAALAERGVV